MPKVTKEKKSRIHNDVQKQGESVPYQTKNRTLNPHIFNL